MRGCCNGGNLFCTLRPIPGQQGLLGRYCRPDARPIRPQQVHPGLGRERGAGPDVLGVGRSGGTADTLQRRIGYSPHFQHRGQSWPLPSSSPRASRGRSSDGEQLCRHAAAGRGNPVGYRRGDERATRRSRSSFVALAITLGGATKFRALPVSARSRRHAPEGSPSSRAPARPPSPRK